MSAFISLNQVHRQLELMVQAVWGRSIRLLELPESGDGCPRLEADTLYLPAVMAANTTQTAHDAYLCATLHASAHLMYSQPRESEGFNNRQLVLTSLIEDARVEALLLQKLPGLRPLLLAQFDKAASDSLIFEEFAYATAFSLLKQEVVVENPLVHKVFDQFSALSDVELHNPYIAQTLGLALANDIGQMRISMNEKTHFELVRYRDDNAYLWQKNTQIGIESQDQASTAQAEKVSITGIAYQEILNGKAASEYQEQVQKQPGLVFLARQNDSEHTLMPTLSQQKQFCYPEWDYKIARLKKAWCTVNETHYETESAQPLSERQLAHQRLIQQLQKIIQSYQANRQRRRHQEQGMELDLSAMIEQMVELKTSQVSSESKIYIDQLKPAQSRFALMVLLDLSESMKDAVDEQHALLDLTLDATIVLSGLLDALGHTYAVHGFHSNTRKQVEAMCFKDFEDDLPLNITALERVQAQYSTRLGASLRHAFELIQSRPERHKLILVVSDGVPSDVDVHDDRYLIEDAAYAVREIESWGCKTFCLSLDQTAEDYAAKIFHRGHYAVLNHPQKLPRILTEFYLKLFREAFA